MTAWRSVLMLLGALGCSANHTSNDAQIPSGSAQESAAMLASSLQVEVNAQDVRLVFHITNTSNQPIVLEFNSGQRYDFAVHSGGRELWRWSADRMFTQALGTETIAPGETLRYSERWPVSGTAGQLTAIAELKSTNHPIQQRAVFERR